MQNKHSWKRRNWKKEKKMVLKGGKMEKVKRSRWCKKVRRENSIWVEKEERVKRGMEGREEKWKRALLLCSAASQTFRQINKGKPEQYLWVRHTRSVCYRSCKLWLWKSGSLSASGSQNTDLPGRECICVNTDTTVDNRLLVSTQGTRGKSVYF